MKMKTKSPPGILLLLPFAAITLLAPSSAAAGGGRRPRQARPDTPWEDLRASLSSPDALNLPTVVDWREQCLDPMIFDEAPLPDPFHLYGYDIGYAPAGVCMIHMSCMYPGCEYKFAGPESCPAGQEECVRPNSALEPPFDASDLFDDEMELPAAVLHPRTAADVVRGVRFAKEHGVGVSVKVVGHSYFGSSTARGTLLIKMSTSYPMYGMDGSLTECDIGIDAGDDSAGGAACDLAAARGKKAYIRVGGGELFDTAYRAVFFDWNEDPANENNKYHFVGGYAGTVSAAGGWMHSGGLSGASMRLHGIGVDQVLHVEMVTPGGEHVRFGPTAWEDREGGIYPTTTEVTGYCNARPEEEDESLWEWAECEGEIDFADLWYAVRGGGGGTFGIVTSLYYQLHDLPGRVQVLLAHDDEFVTREDLIKTGDILVDYLKFAFTFLYLPEKLNNVTEVESRSCNAPGTFMSLPYNSLLNCHNSVGDKFIEEWKAYVKGGLTATNYGDDAAFMSHVEGLWNILSDHPSQGYVVVRDDEPHKGRLQDDRGVLLSTDIGYGFDHVPLHTVTNYMDELVDIMVQEANAGVYLGHYLMGGAVPESTDQMNSVGPLRRDAAFARTSLAGVDKLYKNFYDLVWRDAGLGPGSDFPGINCHNHASNENMGPLKEDWSRPCPGILEMPQEEREEKCVSQAESFWGTANVARLEEVKSAVDPDELFICNAGIGASSPFIGRNASGTGGYEALEEVDPPVNGEAGKADTEEGGDPATVDKEEGTGGGDPAATDGDNESAPANEDEAKDDGTDSPASSSFYSKGVMFFLILAMSLVI